MNQKQTEAVTCLYCGRHSARQNGKDSLYHYFKCFNPGCPAGTYGVAKTGPATPPPETLSLPVKVKDLKEARQLIDYLKRNDVSASLALHPAHGAPEDPFRDLLKLVEAYRTYITTICNRQAMKDLAGMKFIQWKPEPKAGARPPLQVWEL